MLSTLQTLLDTGDRLIKVEGIFSGTLSYIFNTFGPSTPFSEVVTQAKDAGYTEPDPRDDLNGMQGLRVAYCVDGIVLLMQSAVLNAR